MTSTFKSVALARTLSMVGGKAITLTAFNEALAARHATHRDHNITAGQLEYSKGWLYSSEMGRLPMTREGMVKFMIRCGLPAATNLWLLENAKEEWVTVTKRVFERWQSENQSKGWLVRTAVNEQGERRVRGLLTDGYRIIDDITAGQALQVSLEEVGAGDALVHARVGENFVHMEGIRARVVLPSHLIRRQPGDNSDLNAQLVYNNNELGERSLSVAAGIFRVLCLNGLIAGSIDAMSRIRHAGKMEVDLAHLRGLTTNALSQIQGMGDSFANLADVQLAHPAEALTNLSQSVGLGKRAAQRVIDSSLPANAGEFGSNAYAVVNAVTLGAQKVEGDRRTEMEQAAGKLLTLSAARWKAADFVDAMPASVSRN